MWIKECSFVKQNEASHQQSFVCVPPARCAVALAVVAASPPDSQPTAGKAGHFVRDISGGFCLPVRLGTTVNKTFAGLNHSLI
jgi:hypothetical protein